MSLTPEELTARLKDMQDGPWAARSAAARGLLKPHLPLDALSQAAQTIDLHALPLKAADQRREPELKRLFRWHGTGGIDSAADMRIRDSFDFALGYLQLVELAIECGYLDVEQVRSHARRELCWLLWSEGAREFVRLYDYLAVAYLATRVGIHGLPATSPPPIEANASIRFARLLATHVEWVCDGDLEEWLGFLDDYIEEEGEQNRLYEYLTGKKVKPPRRVGELLRGLDRYVTLLSQLFETLDGETIPRVGLLYAYWLAKFFGYRLTPKNGYVRNVSLWDDTDGWAATILQSPSVLRRWGVKESSSATDLRRRVAILRGAWRKTARLVAKSR
jgi:hypothetical protein